MKLLHSNNFNSVHVMVNFNVCICKRALVSVRLSTLKYFNRPVESPTVSGWRLNFNPFSCPKSHHTRHLRKMKITGPTCASCVRYSFWWIYVGRGHLGHLNTWKRFGGYGSAPNSAFGLSAHSQEPHPYSCDQNHLHLWHLISAEGLFKQPPFWNHVGLYASVKWKKTF